MTGQIRLFFSGRDLTTQECTVSTSQSVGSVSAIFEFDGEWESYPTKTAVFIGSGVNRAVVLDDSGRCVVPWEVLAKPGYLEIGVIGQNGETIMPSVKTSVFISEGICSSGQPPVPPSPDVYQQIVDIMAETKSIAQSVRDDADAGKFDGADGAPGDVTPAYLKLAEQIRQNAESASDSKDKAKDYAGEAKQHADNANQYEGNAAVDAGLAQVYASMAQGYAEAASSSAESAQASKAAAETSAKEAEAAKASIVTAEAEREQAENERAAAEILREQEKAACIEATEKCKLATEAALTQFSTVADIQRVTRLGHHQELLPVGDQITVNRATSVTVSVGSSTGITAASVSPAAFIGKVGTAESKLYEMTWDGSVWKRENGETAALPQYGITVTGVPAEGDCLLITVTANELTFDILDHDKHVPQATGLTHSLALGSHAVIPISSVAPSTAQLLYYAPEGLAAGSYRFTLDHGCYGGTTIYDGTYFFTLTQAIPAGGGFRHSNIGGWKSNYAAADVIGNYIQTYGAQPAREAVESDVAVTVWDGETACTDLGNFTARDKTYQTQDGNHNYAEKNAGGSNRWRDSALRQWLNSDAAAGTEANGVSNWWTPQSVFDMPPKNAGIAGFLFGMDPAFVSSLGYVKLVCALSICDVTEETKGDIVYDRVWLQAAVEVFGDAAPSASKSAVEGVQLAYWHGASDADRIKYNNGAALPWWLRSPTIGPAAYNCIVRANGTASSSVCELLYGVVPACCIV